MTSVDSIGSCSLDFDASDNFDNYAPKYGITASSATLRSSRLVSSLTTSPLNEEDGALLKNGHLHDGKPDRSSMIETKLPSYVGISCAINGYTNYSRFCRSRDNSPARGFRKSSLESNLVEEKVQEALDNVRCSRSQSDCNGNATSLFTKTIQGGDKFPMVTKKYMKDSMTSTVQSFSSIPEQKKSANGHATDKYPLAREVGNGETKSLVQQRIESLYGVSAQEKAKLPCRTGRTGDRAMLRKNGAAPKRSPSCPPQVIKSHLDNSLPVFRHLTKDFKEQLLLDDAIRSESNTEKRNIPMKKRHTLPPEPLTEESNSKSPIANGVSSNGFHSLPTELGIDECDRVADISPVAVSEILSPNLNGMESGGKSATEKDGHVFISLMEAQRLEIQDLIWHWEAELMQDIPEEASGKIRAACGKANLLLSQKFEQFKGLCSKNIEESRDTPFYTTQSDLAGFWDLVMLQVDDIKSTFTDIEALKRNDWKEVSPEKPNVFPCRSKKSSLGMQSRSNPCTPKRTAKSAELAKAREEARKQLMAAKKKGRQQNCPAEDDVAIFLPSNTS